MTERKPMRALWLAIILLGSELGLRWGGAGAATTPAAADLPAGEYACLKSRLTYSSIRGPGGPLLMVQYDPSVIGSIALDGHGGYRAFKKSGRYTFDSAHRRFAFVSGPLQGWPAAYRNSRGVPALRLAATKSKTVGEKDHIGEHLCRRRGSKETPKGQAPGNGVSL